MKLPNLYLRPWATLLVVLSISLEISAQELVVKRETNAVSVSWPPSDLELQSARDVSGPWSTVPDPSNPQITSTRLGQGQSFFRLAQAARLPEGFRMEKVVDGLTYPTSVVWDDQNRMFVLEAGGSFVEEPAKARILLVEDGRATEFINLDGKVGTPAVGLLWHAGSFYITHRHKDDRTGTVSRVDEDGTVTQLITGIVDSQAEHFLNDIRMGPDGMVYFCGGPAANSAVVGADLGPFISRSPNLHTTSAIDLVLTGRNFLTPDFRTEDPTDLVETGAYVPFGTATTPGQVIRGTNKPGGAILVFDLADPEGTLRPYAFGLRNVIGMAWNGAGEMFAAVNGYDIRGSRPVNDLHDATYRVREGTWYGWPDFSAAFDPLTSAQFESPFSQGAPIMINGVPAGKKLGFVIDHKASGLTPPDKSLILGMHEVNSSPCLMDVAPPSWTNFAGQVFVAEWGDLAPPTNPLQNGLPGYRISRIDPETGKVTSFAENEKPGPASAQGMAGQGLERPFGLRFGPDDAMYVVDYGIARINPALAAKNKPPYEFPPETGVLWKISRQAVKR